MAENYKHLYEQTKMMLAMYQDEIVPGFRKQIEKLEAKSKWIPVSERLPDETKDEYVLVVCDYYGKVKVETRKMWHIDACVTHWMPLPEPPKEV